MTKTDSSQQDGIADIAATAQMLRVPMTHVPRDAEYLPVLAYRVGQMIDARERELRNLRNLHGRIERIAPDVV